MTDIAHPGGRVARPTDGRTVSVGPLDVASVLAVLAALGAIFYFSPTERVQGDVFRILYVHLSMAWLAYAAFSIVFGASVAYLLRRRRGADNLARAAAEIGLVCTSLVLATGVLWGRPVWGVWWTWDARLTTTLVLWFSYVGYFMVRSAILDPDRAARVGAVIGIVGFVNVPVVQLSVTWWRTLHPAPSVTRPGALTPEMTAVLFVSLIAFSLLFARLITLRLGVLRAQGALVDLIRRHETREGA